jgi:hypothetical protein
MTRLAIFGIVGPFVGFLVLIGLGGGFRSHAIQAFFIVLPFAMIAGFVPAVLTGLFDRAFEKWRVRPLDRYIGIAAVGYGAAYILALENLFETTPLVPIEYRWGLVGAIPAALCSWLNKQLSP